MRLFVALELPEEVVDHLSAAVAPLREQHPRLGWVPSERWHLTLAFLGEVGPDVLPDLEARLGRAASRAVPMGLRITGAGRFSSRVFWAGVNGRTAELVRLAQSCTAAARRCKIEVDERPLHPHVTLARGRGRDPVDLRPLVDSARDYSGPSWVARDLALIRSWPGPKPRYERLSAWPFPEKQPGLA